MAFTASQNYPSHPQITHWVGLDVHKNSTTVAWADLLGNNRKFCTCGSSHAEVEQALTRFIKSQQTQMSSIAVTYEIGANGFNLARHLLSRGFAVTVSSSRLLLNRPGRKSDISDALALARMLMGGCIRPVHVPDGTDEIVRTVCRRRTDANREAGDLARKLKSLLQRYDTSLQNVIQTSQPVGLSSSVESSDPSIQIVIRDLSDRITDGEKKLRNLEKQLAALLVGWHRKTQVEAIMGLKGFDITSAMIVASEIGDFARFDHPKKLASYLGLVSREHGSGKSRKQGPITKAGNSHVRWILVQAAKNYRTDTKVSDRLRKRQKHLPHKIKEFSSKSQERLSGRFQTLKKRSMPTNKIHVAIARELSQILWELIVKILPAE